MPTTRVSHQILTWAAVVLLRSSTFAAAHDSALLARFEELEHRMLEQEKLVRAQAAEIQSQGTIIHNQEEEIQKLEGTSSRRLSVGDLASAMDHMWFIICGALVMFMQAGFAMVEAGCCRAKNVQNILLKNLTDVCMGTLGWWATGYAFSALNFPDEDGDGFLDGGFIGSNNFFGSGFAKAADDGVITVELSPKQWFFQWAFCSAASTIVSGGVAERVKFPAYCCFSFLMTAFIYPVVVAWTWGYGWLASINDVGYMDFAGSGIVHMAGGVGALVGAIISGSREGRWERPSDFAPHSLPLIVLGTFILWFGWYGFNCGSTLELHTAAKGTLAAQVAMNTTISAATGGLVVLGLRFVIGGRRYDIGGMCNGILAGLVSITAPCGNVECGSAFLIGLLGGLVYQGASSLMQKIHVDDPIDAFAVHGACGAWGVLAAALFDWGKGFDHVHGWNGWDCLHEEGDSSKPCASGLGGQLLAANILEIVMITLWVGTMSAMVFLPLRLIGFLRADSETQEQGMDEAKHSPTKAYTLEDVGSNAVVVGKKVAPA